MKSDYKSTRKPKNIQYLRNSNRAEIIRRLATKGLISRTALASELQLTKMAISTIVTELIEEGFIEECGVINDTPAQQYSASSGRKATALTIPDYRINAIGIYILRYKIEGIAVDIKGTPIFSASTELPPGTDNARFTELLISLIEKIIYTNSHIAFSGIGIASIGPLDISGQIILNPPNFRKIENIRIGEIVREHFGLPVFLDNDMNAGALAEHLYGIAKEINDIVYLGLGSGVGAGIIVNGRMLHGSGGFAGEVGHMSIQIDGLPCSCGRKGCLEVYTNTIDLLRNTGAETIDELRETAMGENVPPTVRRCLDGYMRAVLSGLVTIANTFDPEAIIIGDNGAILVSLYLEQLEKEMNAQMFQRESRHIRLSVSSFGKTAPLIGAAAMVFEKIFSGEIPL